MITIIDYGMGNLQSIKNAVEMLDSNVVVTDNPKDLERATGIILPGVGAFGDGMKNLKERGFLPFLHQLVIEKKKPYLGICLGMQFLAKKSHEHGAHDGFGWIDGEVKIIKPENQLFKIPHIGWNDVVFQKSSEEKKSCLFAGLGEKETFYFVHSYALELAATEREIMTGRTSHGTEIVASIQKGNILGVQFHPEKSQGAGLKVLENFIQHVKRNSTPQK